MNKVAFRLCFVSVFLALVVVVLGAFTRLADAGLGCPDWPTCYGHLWVPTSESDINAANEAFAETPVEQDKTWPEQLHRIIASSLGLLILALFYFCYRHNRDIKGWGSVQALLGLLVGATITRMFVGDSMDVLLLIISAVYFLNLSRLATRANPQSVPFKLPSFIAGLVVLQGLFGMWTVTLYLWPQVVTAHLLGGFTIFTLLWLLLQRLGQWHWHADAASVVTLMNLRGLALLLLIAVAIQIALGGWVSSNYAALACPDFPLCQNQLWPESSFSRGFNFFQDIGPNYLGGVLDNQARVAIHMSHRIGALVVVVLTLVFAFKLWQSAYPQARNFSYVLIAVLLVQVTLGILNIVLALPLSIAVIHNMVGAFLLITVVTINHRLRTVQTL